VYPDGEKCALLINLTYEDHPNPKRLPLRVGANEDQTRLKRTLKRLGFKRIFECFVLTREGIIKKLDEFKSYCETRKGPVGACLVVVMGHGSTKRWDHLVTEDDQEQFLAFDEDIYDKFHTLTAPKVFMFNVCR
jgi:hypothetical protein